jgi:dTDP-glucose 4,6-dehydratase
MDFIYDFACPASPEDYLRWGLETLDVGSSGTRNCLELAHRYKAGFFLASTSETYGDPDVHPQSESYWGYVNPIGPRSVYDEAKRFSEALTMAYHRYRGVDTRIVRIFNTYGPRLQLDDGRVISNFMKQALLGNALTIYGDGSQSREHLPVNIGNPGEFTMLECAQMVLEVTGSASKLVFAPLPQDDPKQRCPDISKAKALLGWEPTIDLRSGLRMSLNYFRESLAAVSRS